MRNLLLIAFAACASYSQVAIGSITPGVFKMYSEPNKIPNEGCDIYSTLEITESGSAILTNGVDGLCEIYVAPNKKTYSKLKLISSSCSKIYSATKRGSNGELVSLQIEDNRENICEMPIKALIVATEKMSDREASITLYSHNPSSRATPNKFVCSSVGGVDEWTIYIDLNKKIAGFFDNDNTSVVPLKQMLVLESFPPQYTYTFEGKDSGGGSEEVLRVYFNKTMLEGSVTFDALGRNPSTKDAEGGCVADDSIDLDIE